MKKVIKRDGTIVSFRKEAIINAVEKAMACTPTGVDHPLATYIATTISEIDDDLSVEEIQNIVESMLMSSDRKDVAREYVRYRFTRENIRNNEKSNNEILEIIDMQNEYVKTENSNKNPSILSTQRDYIAGAVSKDLTNRLLLPADIVEAHKNGLIHFHDADYFVQHMFNCSLLAMDDILQNGTVINGTLIERPHSFATACNIATQVMAQVASNQYGGQSVTLSHLAPFVDVSRNKIREAVKRELADIQIPDLEKEALVVKITESRVKDEIKRGVQTIQYQINTLMTTNGQAPFVTIFMYLNEVEDGQLKDDLAMIIEEVVKQRYEGVKNKNGVWITPAFPKLVYVLEEDNIKEDGKYYYLTKLCAKCTAKRLVPDYVSEKIMFENKVDKNGNGHCYPPMGCVDGSEVVTYTIHGNTYVESLERMWDRLSNYYEIKTQPNGTDKYMDTKGVEIYDSKVGFVKNHRIIRNHSTSWMRVTFKNGRSILCTEDHPFETENRGVVLAKDLSPDDTISIDRASDFIDKTKLIPMKDSKAWMYGFLLCDSTYTEHITASIDAHTENDIEKFFCDVARDDFGLNTNIILQQRGEKGTYKDLHLVPSDNLIPKLSVELISLFGGKAKKTRHIPNEVFTWCDSARTSFLAGMIDADGYINSTGATTVVQIGSTNKELAIQQMLLAQTLGMGARTYTNHYSKKNKDNIRYRVEFVPNSNLLSKIICKKKTGRDINLEPIHASPCCNEMTSIIRLEKVEMSAYSYDVTTDSEHFTVSGLYSHNCRSFLTPYIDENGNPKYYGRFNQGVVTINLVDVGLSANKDEEKFWEIFDERLELCHRALQLRHKRLEGTPSDVSPIHWQYGAIARLQPGETIDKLLHGGYSTISLGYAGLHECTMAMIGGSHTHEKGKEFALKVMQHMNDKCNEWKAAENIDYSIYGTPLESTVYKFATCLKNRFGEITGITDKDYITNSYHVHVTEHISAFDKLKLESEFQKLSPGGAISYIEAANMTNNLDAVIAVIKYIYGNIMYAEINTKSDYCQVCGYDGEIEPIVDRKKKISLWRCPNCGNSDQNKMNVARRTCGYIGSNFWNFGRTEEIQDRYVHLGDD